jgi:DNA (cytosine-5)-methyltransferase 1
VNYLSLFSGIGGFEIGIQNAYRGEIGREEEASETRDSAKRNDTARAEKRFDSEHDSSFSRSQKPSCIGYSEIDKHAIATYEKNFKGATNYGDITKINSSELPDFDLIVGGFPCQTFSIAGKRKGFEDTRGTLFFDIARILSDKRPRHLVLENVKGLLTHDSGKTFQTILTVLSYLGYVVEWQVLNSKHFGVPQNRERVYIIGHLGTSCGRKIFPFRPNSQNNFLSNVIGPTLTSRYPASQREGTYIKEERKTGSESFKIRKLTPVECERLQGFPDNWTGGVSDSQRYKQTGNAVTTNTVQAVIKKLIPCLEANS